MGVKGGFMEVRWCSGGVGKVVRKVVGKVVRKEGGLLRGVMGAMAGEMTESVL